MKLFTKQGLALMKAAKLQRPDAGQGVSVAIMDTGINYNHVALGGGGFPNQKVIGGYDFAGKLDLTNPKSPKPRPDADPLDPPTQSHGTWCASIAAGSLMPKSDYAGGVAPAAKLYALKVFGDSFPYTYDSWQLSAYEWILKNQHKDPANPIMIVSMSLGRRHGRHPKLARERILHLPGRDHGPGKTEPGRHHRVRGFR